MLGLRTSYQQQGFGPPSPASSPSSSSKSRCCVFTKNCNTSSTSKWSCCCCTTSSQSSASFLTSLGVFVLVLGYTLLGAVLFMLLEGGDQHYKSFTARQKTNAEIRAETVEKLWSITEDLNILYKDNWTRLAAEEVMKFQERLSSKVNGEAGVALKGGTGESALYTPHTHKWSFASSYLYSLTLVTTIGYGSIAPKTVWGKLATIAYAVLGIPLMLIYLSTTGEILSKKFRTMAEALFCVKNKKPAKENTKAKRKKLRNETTFLNTSFDHRDAYIPDGKIPFVSTDELPGKRAEDVHTCERQPAGKGTILLSFLFVFLYVSGGAYLFHYFESWTYVESTLFCFTSLSTIGFGDMMPGLKHNMGIDRKSTMNEAISVLFTSCFILLGMAFLSMAFNLIQDQVVLILKRLTTFFRIVTVNVESKEDVEGITMSIVSSTTS